MFDAEKTEAFNSKPRIDLNNIKRMTASQLDRVKQYGSHAEQLLQNKEFAQFIHHYRFELCDQLAQVSGYTLEDNNQRIAIGNMLAGIDGFIANLQRAKYYKDRVVSQQQPVEDPTE